MAEIIKRTSKYGKLSYLIRVSAGRTISGKKIRQCMTYTPPESWSEQRAEKEAQRQALQFEERVNAGAVQDGRIKFADFAELWFKNYAEKNLKTQTVDAYRKLLPRINEGIGHIRLCELRTGHLNQFYAELQEAGRRDVKWELRRNVDLMGLRSKTGHCANEFAAAAGVGVNTVQAAARGEHINIKTADSIAAALGMRRVDLFSEAAAKSDVLDANTIKSYHRLISSILTKAVKWGYITVNPAANAETPRKTAKEPAYLDESEARRLLECLATEPIKYRAAITFDLLSGLRRGELLGLRWEDVDFENETIRVVQTLEYTRDNGVYLDTPKNTTSSRPLKLSHSAFVLLREVQAWQDEQRALLGDSWHNKDGLVFVKETGKQANPNCLSVWFKTFAKRNGFPAGLHLHSLRHTYASLMIADGTPLVVVSRRMGHAQVSTTANIYSHLISSADEKAAQISDVKFADIIQMQGKLQSENGTEESAS